MTQQSISILADEFLAGAKTMSVLVSLDSRIAFTNPAWNSVLGSTATQMFGYPIHSLIEADQLELWERMRETVQNTQQAVTLELVLRGLSGETVPVRGEAWPVIRNERVIAIGAAVCDTRTFAQISHPAMTRTQKDELTGLLNRQGFVTKSLDTLAGFAAEEDVAVKPWIVACNIKHYATLCEAGADVAAVVLKEVSNALRASVRGQDVIGRIEGDLFGALLMLPPSYSPTMVIARLRAAIRTRKNTMKLPDEIELDVRINPIGPDANWNQIQALIDPSAKALEQKGTAMNKPLSLMSRSSKSTEQDGDSAFV